MKRCPECGRDYNDDSLRFCLDDGAELLFGPAAGEPATAILDSFRVLPSGGSSPDASTLAFHHTTASEAEPPTTIENRTERQSLSAHRAAQPHEAESEKAKNMSAGMMAGIVLGVVALVGGYFGYGYLKSSGGSGRLDSIAVLPFENRSGNTDTDYLSDGLTDSLIFRFSQLPNLKVSPTSSVMRYKGRAEDVAQIAKDLDVDAVLSGRLTQIGDSLDISVQLIDARSGKLVWAEQYDRKMADLMATQREIATTLTQKMQLKLAGNEQGITKKYTTSNEAYQLYLRGRYHWSRRVKDDLLKAIDSYDKAIEIDPNFALAYAGKAEAYNSMGKDPDAAPKECIPAAKAAATRALEIDPTLPQAHSALADALAIYDWNWAESESHFKKAFELDPNISYIHLVYAGSYLPARQRTAESVKEAERALELEPLSLINNSVAVGTYVKDRQYPKALDQARKAFELDPNFPLARYWLGMALVANGKYDEAITISQQAPADSPSAWMSLVSLAHAYAKTGNRPEAEKQIAKMEALRSTRYVRTYYLASIHATLGDKDKAFAELEKSFEDHDCFLNQIAADPFMDPLRGDPRFKDLMRRMNLGQ
ncbi:MAG: hypothetical protein DMF63_10210 [Acidobacteria bacterium]|nr:MAG: hypothetical protein DMF63_10210 [Acidobacteriota bacterium]